MEGSCLSVGCVHLLTLNSLIERVELPQREGIIPVISSL